MPPRAPMLCYVARILMWYLHCRESVPRAPKRTKRPVFVRDPGTDDERPLDRRGEFPTRYPVNEAV